MTFFEKFISTVFQNLRFRNFQTVVAVHTHNRELTDLPADDVTVMLHNQNDGMDQFVQRLTPLQLM